MTKLVMAGCGTVGSAVANWIINSGTGISLEKVLIKDDTKERSVRANFTLLPEELFEDEADILVEVIGGTTLAYHIDKRALQRGTHVVTANKALIATHGRELHQIAQENGVSLLYEAAVAGSIPIMNVFRNSLQGDQINFLEGILNGTSNFMLTRMAEGMDYQQALSLAQERGFAEADPSFDVSGKDAAQKLAILASKLSGRFVDYERIPTEGIDHLQNVDFEITKSSGYVIKSVGHYSDHGKKGIEVWVRPVLLPANHPFAQVNEEVNAVMYHGDLSGSQIIIGKGAGGNPTASAVISDIVSIQNGHSETLAQEEANYVAEGQFVAEGYLRCLSRDVPGTLEKIAGILGRHRINIAEVTQKRKYQQGDLTPDAFLVDKTSIDVLDKAMEEIASSGVVEGKPYFLRIQGGEYNG